MHYNVFLFKIKSKNTKKYIEENKYQHEILPSRKKNKKLLLMYSIPTHILWLCRNIESVRDLVKRMVRDPFARNGEAHRK